MIRRGLPALLILLAACRAAPRVDEQDADVFNRVAAATVQIVRRHPDGGTMTFCTGFVFRKTADGYLVATAAHCLADESLSLLGVVPHDSPPNVLIPFHVVKAGDEIMGEDFGILEIKTKTEIEPLPFGDEHKLPRDHSGRAPGRVVSVFEHPYLGEMFCAGEIRAMRARDLLSIAQETDWTGYEILSIPIVPGASGSAVYSEQQKAVVGIIVGTYGDVFSVAIPISRVRVP